MSEIRVRQAMETDGLALDEKARALAVTAGNVCGFRL